MTSVWNNVMKLGLMIVPLLVLGFCLRFFWVVFDRTMAQCEHEHPVVQFSIANDCSSNAVLQVVSSDTVKEIVGSALTEREQIVEREHTKFRAELGTWLSVFGLLTILVTLVTPVCSLVFQQKEFERLQKLIDSQAKSIEEIMVKQKEITQTAKQVEEARRDVINDKSSIAADLEEKHTQRECQDGLRSVLNYFKGLWGEDRLEEKISAGIRLFGACNTAITDAIENDDYDNLKNCLNVVNNANAYLGMNNVTEFREVFSQRMQVLLPLKHSNEEVVNALEKGGIDGPITGFYKKALSLQGGIHG